MPILMHNKNKDIQTVNNPNKCKNKEKKIVNNVDCEGKINKESITLKENVDREKIDIQLLKIY